MKKKILNTIFSFLSKYEKIAIKTSYRKFIPSNITVVDWYSQLTLARQIAAAMEHRVRSDAKIVHDEKISRTSLKVGDFVLAKFDTVPEGLRRKLANHLQGPFIVKWIRDSIAGIEDTNNEGSVIEVPITKLAFFRGDPFQKREKEEIDIQKIVEEKEFEGEAHYRLRLKGLSAEEDIHRPVGDIIRDYPQLVRKWTANKEKKPISLSGGAGYVEKEKKGGKLQVHEIVAHKREGKHFIFTVKELPGVGPEHYKHINKGQLANVAVLEKYVKDHGLEVRMSRPPKKSGEHAEFTGFGGRVVLEDIEILYHSSLLL